MLTELRCTEPTTPAGLIRPIQNLLACPSCLVQDPALFMPLDRGRRSAGQSFHHPGQHAVTGDRPRTRCVGSTMLGTHGKRRCTAADPAGSNLIPTCERPRGLLINETLNGDEPVALCAGILAHRRHPGGHTVPGMCRTQGRRCPSCSGTAGRESHNARRRHNRTIRREIARWAENYGEPPEIVRLLQQAPPSA